VKGAIRTSDNGDAFLYDDHGRVISQTRRSDVVFYVRQYELYGEWGNSQSYELHDISRIIRITSFIQLSSFPGIDKELNCIS